MSPGIVFELFFVMNLILWSKESSEADLVVWRICAAYLRWRFGFGKWFLEHLGPYLPDFGPIELRPTDRRHHKVASCRSIASSASCSLS